MRAKARDAGDAADGTASSRFAASSLRYDPSAEEIDHGRNQASGHVWPGGIARKAFHGTVVPQGCAEWKRK